MRIKFKGLFTIFALFVIMGTAVLPVKAAEIMANGAGYSATGTIDAPAALYVFAPVSGQVGNFAWVPGDRVAQGDLAFIIQPSLVRAAADGEIAGLRAQTGDLAQNVQAQYGALCWIRRDGILNIQATITYTGDEAENRDIRVGQTLRLQRGTGDSKLRAEGTVFFRSDKSFLMELDRGEFELEDDVKVYLGDTKDYTKNDFIGNGAVARPDNLPVMGEGMIASVLVENGEKVSRGQPLFMLDSAGARYEAGSVAQPQVSFDMAGIIAEVLVRPGQHIQQGQAVMTILPQGPLEAKLKVDELDIAHIRPGDIVTVRVDAYGQEREGTITEILPLGQAMLDTTKFLVKVAFDKSDDLMIGMHVKAYWK